MKKAVGVAIGTLAFVIAGAAVYGVFSLNETIQAKPDQIQVSNYSAEIGSLKPQINSINNNMSSLNNLKGDISDIRGKLTDLESKISQAQQGSVLAVTLGRSIYLQGDSAYITASGLSPKEAVQIQLLDSTGFVIIQEQTKSDSSGKLTISLPLPSTVAPGNFQIKIISGEQTASQPIMIVSSSQSLGSVLLTGSYPFSAQPDQSVYLPSDTIEVFGTGVPNTTITGTLASPSGITYGSTTTTSSDGSYRLSYFTSQSSERGYWTVNLTNQGQTRTVSIYVGEPSSTSSGSSSSFTAQTDKIIYKQGDPIIISGVGKPYTAVKATLTSPSGNSYDTAITAHLDGSYVLSFDTSPSYETGNWYISITNWSLTKVISIYLEPMS